MRKTQKILTATLWGLTVFAMMTVIGAGLWKRQRARAATENSLEVLGNVPSFSLVDQDARPFTNQMLAGKPFVVDFIFTNCAGPCPVMTEKMAGLQKEMADPRVQLVTVTVDPERDTPAVLKEYAKEHGADEARWHFLTGEKNAVFALARGMLLVAEPAQGNRPILHSEGFMLVDGLGQMRGHYHSKDDQAMKQLVHDAEQLAGTQSEAAQK